MTSSQEELALKEMHPMYLEMSDEDEEHEEYDEAYAGEERWGLMEDR